jgi:putative DNA primase/helicase
MGCGLSVEIIAAALGSSYRSGSWWRCRCPVHQSSGATLALRDGPQGLIACCHAGCRGDDVLDELCRLGLLSRGGDLVAVAKIVHREAEQRDRQRRIAAALDFWHHETVSPDGTAVERHWRARGLAPPMPSTLRASRSWLRHPEGGCRPAMVALVEHVDHGPTAIHRTWLTIDGTAKASFRTPRLSLGPTGGAAVRLAHANQRQPLVVAEGIETAAAVMTATGLPTWAALSATGIERLILPPLPLAAIVIIAADHDRNGVGERAARTAAQRWLAEGRRVRIALPPVPDSDWNDILLSRDHLENAYAA